MSGVFVVAQDVKAAAPDMVADDFRKVRLVCFNFDTMRLLTTKLI